MSATVVVEQAAAGPTQRATATVTVQGGDQTASPILFVVLGLLAGALLVADGGLRRRVGRGRQTESR